MAGKGPAPKQVRQRTPAPARGDWVQLSDAPTGPPPPLPRPYPRGGYSPLAKAEWSRWWTSPASHQWLEADRGILEMLVVMVHEWSRSTPPRSTKLAVEIRQLRDSLGLTPKGRQDRRWLAPSLDTDDDTAPTLAVVTPIRSRNRPDPRKRSVPDQVPAKGEESNGPQ